jgi:ATP-dependent exoDNAse (exonuclease V) beta subunit
VPELLAFVNDVCGDMQKAGERRDAFRYDEQDRFPLDAQPGEKDGPLGLVLAETAAECAEATAAEIGRLISQGVAVRDRETGMARPIRPSDVGILFRSRESHRDFEDALARRGITAYVHKGLGFFDADEVKDVLALLWYLADPASDLRVAAFLRSRLVGLSDEGLRRLAPRIAESLSVDAPVNVSLQLDGPDARRLEDVREASRRWRALVDRMPPSELLDLVLSESSYAVELRGPRFRQAQENLKKLRALVRRTQNRGYTTIRRIAEHFERLAVGDESNALVDALDGVGLMTIHASKGLEFPVVFVANLSRGTSGRHGSIRVSLDPSDGVPTVEIGDFQEERDRVDSETDREETKRLVYVALTRARDRLYLATLLEEGQVRPGQGSLAEVLPTTLLDQLIARQTSGPVEWQASSGVVHRFGLCPSGDLQPCAREQAPAPLPGDFAPLTEAGLPRRTVGEVVGGAPSAWSRISDVRSDRLTGTVVHRLLQRVGLDHGLSVDELRSLVPRLLRAGESHDGYDVGSWADEVAVACSRLSSRQEVRTAYESGECWHEVPFTMKDGSGIVRGSIDCLVRSRDGTVTVLEFKTGRRRPEHREQTELYRKAAGALFPGIAVDALLVYSEG